jgi:hypothetical protein
MATTTPVQVLASCLLKDDGGVVVYKERRAGTFTYRAGSGEMKTLTVDFVHPWLHIDDTTNEVLTASEYPFPYARSMWPSSG